MRSLSTILCLFIATSLIGQLSTQWHTSIYHTEEHYDDGVFIEEGLNNTLLSVWLESTNQNKAALTINKIDQCGLNIEKSTVSGLDINPKWLCGTARDSKGNLYIAGLMDSIMPHGTLFILKITPQLQVSWLKTFDFNMRIYPYSFAVNTQDEVFVMFNTLNQPFGNSLLKIDQKGAVIWAKSFGFTGSWGRGGPTSDGGFLHSTGSTSFKTDAFGNMQWRTYVQGAHTMSTPLEIDGGYLFYQGYPGSSRVNRLLMLNLNGSLRWVSKDLNHFNGIFLKRLSPTQALVVGEGSSNHPSSPNIRSVAYLKVNTLAGNIVKHKGVFRQAESLYGYGFDFLTAANNQDFLVEKKINSLGKHQTSLTKLPANLDSISCLEKYDFPPADTSTYTVQSLPTINALDLNFTINNLAANIIVLQTSTLNQWCSNVPETSSFSLGNDTVLCPGESIVLSGPALHQYNWSTGEETRNITVSEEGWYRLTTSLKCGNTSASDSIYVAYSTNLNLIMDGIKESYFLDDTLNAEGFGGTFGTYYWYINENLVDSGRTLSFTCDSNGVFEMTLIFIDENGCSFFANKTFRVRPEIPEMPNVFTPNNDGVNDRFTPFQSFGAHYTLNIYNRNGTLVSNNINQGWDGKTKNAKTVASGVYFYLLYWENNPKPKKGFVTVIR